MENQPAAISVNESGMQILRPIVGEPRANAIMRVSLTVAAFLLLGSAIGIGIWQITSLEQKKRDLSIEITQQQTTLLGLEESLKQNIALNQKMEDSIKSKADELKDLEQKLEDFAKRAKTLPPQEQALAKEAEAIAKEAEKSSTAHVRLVEDNSKARLFFFVVDDQQRANVWKLAPKLLPRGLYLTNVIMVKKSVKRPDANEVRYFRHPEDEQEAKTILEALRELGLTPSRVSYVKDDASIGTGRKFQIWLRDDAFRKSDE